MLRKFCLLLLVYVFAWSTEVYTKPIIKSGVRSCFKQDCPENTFACEQISKISEDKTQIVVEIHCLGLKNDNLKNITTYEDNPFGANSHFHGYSYSSAYEVTITGSDDDTSMGEKSDKEPSEDVSRTDGIEDFNAR